MIGVKTRLIGEGGRRVNGMIPMEIGEIGPEITASENIGDDV